MREIFCALPPRRDDRPRVDRGRWRTPVDRGGDVRRTPDLAVRVSARAGRSAVVANLEARLLDARLRLRDSGLFAAVITAYGLFFTRTNLLEVNLLVYALPIVSMAFTLLAVRRNVEFESIPGFDRL